jgi:hypothetical protein
MQKRTNPGKTAKNKTSNETNKLVAKNEKFPFLFILFAGFLLTIIYIIWSSIQTYSNELHYDMD